ncbi:MAG TPA: hypothetical protein VIM46_00980 [Luteolibacter sp.]
MPDAIKDVLFVMLMTAGAILGLVLLLAMPILLSQRVQDARKAIPPEVFAAFPQRMGWLRLSHVWKATAVAFCAGNIFRLMHWSEAKSVTDRFGWGLTGVALLWSAIWAVGVLRRRSELDARLVRFAGYVFWPATGGLTVLLLVVYLGNR